ETHRDFSAEGITDPAKVVLPPYYPDHPAIRKDYADYLDSGIRGQSGSDAVSPRQRIPSFR
ncbi:MAG: hypothetical protein ACKOTF_09920, partial [Opitutaceae bacterium]